MANVRRIVVKRSTDGKAYWIDQAANGQVFSTSETYDDLSNAVRAAEDAHPDKPIVIAPEEQQ